LPVALNLDRLRRCLKAKSFGRSVFLIEETGSTNEWARQLAMSGAKEGTITIAATQSSGRGRLRRTWISPVGGLWFSIILRPRMRPADVSKLTILAGLSTAETLQKLYGLVTETKWPNDIVVKGRKICGILGETNLEGEKVNFAILGVGINANFDAYKSLPYSIAVNATSIETELRKKIRLEDLLVALLERLESDYDTYMKSGFANILALWKKHASFLGREVQVTDHEKSITGVAEDVDKDGRLIIRLKNGTLKRLLAGDVSLRKKHKNP
jgi:biotin-[acetyl-CoA-carboxylase] ligase BirA-like protein